MLADTLSLTSSGMCILDNIEHVSILILCFIASSVSIWAQALWIFFALVAPPLAHHGEVKFTGCYRWDTALFEPTGSCARIVTPGLRASMA